MVAEGGNGRKLRIEQSSIEFWDKNERRSPERTPGILTVAKVYPRPRTRRRCMAVRGIRNAKRVVIGIKFVTYSHFSESRDGGRRRTRASPCNVRAVLERRCR